MASFDGILPPGDAGSKCVPRAFPARVSGHPTPHRRRFAAGGITRSRRVRWTELIAGDAPGPRRFVPLETAVRGTTERDCPGQRRVRAPIATMSVRSSRERPPWCRIVAPMPDECECPTSVAGVRPGFTQSWIDGPRTGGALRPSATANRVGQSRQDACPTSRSTRPTRQGAGIAAPALPSRGQARPGRPTRDGRVCTAQSCPSSPRSGAGCGPGVSNLPVRGPVRTRPGGAVDAVEVRSSTARSIIHRLDGFADARA